MYLHSDILRLRAPELSDLDFLFHIENDTRLWVVSACKTPYSRYLLQQYIETNAHDIYADRQVRLMIEARRLFASSGFRELTCLPDWVHSGAGYSNVYLYQRIF